MIYAVGPGMKLDKLISVVLCQFNNLHVSISGSYFEQSSNEQRRLFITCGAPASFFHPFWVGEMKDPRNEFG